MKINIKDLFILNWVKKMLRNIASAKMQIFYFGFVGSTFIVALCIGAQVKFLTAAIPGTTPVAEVCSSLAQLGLVWKEYFVTWATFNTALGTTLAGIREYYKVQPIQGD